VVKVVNGGDKSTYSENTNSNKRAIHIHGGMEQNLDSMPNIIPMDAQKS
jgi:hypothetical protein